MLFTRYELATQAIKEVRIQQLKSNQSEQPDQIKVHQKIELLKKGSEGTKYRKFLTKSPKHLEMMYMHAAYECSCVANFYFTSYVRG